jgi:hypothetical protein
VFGDAVNPEPVRVCRHTWAFFQPKHVVMAPRGKIHFHPHGDLYRDDFAAAPVDEQGLFVHEMVHVWQHQQGVNLPLRRHPFCRYGYSFVPGRPFRRYGIEQQAELVRHAFLLARGRHVPGAPGLETYLGVVPFPGLGRL